MSVGQFFDPNEKGGVSEKVRAFLSNQRCLKAGIDLCWDVRNSVKKASWLISKIIRFSLAAVPWTDLRRSASRVKLLQVQLLWAFTHFFYIWRDCNPNILVDGSFFSEFDSIFSKRAPFECRLTNICLTWQSPGLSSPKVLDDHYGSYTNCLLPFSLM